MPEIGDGDQAPPTLVDDQARIAAEPRMAAFELETGDEFELADARDLGVARVQVDGAGGKTKRLRRRWKRQEQRDDQDAAQAQGEASDSWRRTFAASRRIERSWMPSWSR